MNHVVFLHGFAGGKETYGRIPELLSAAGHAVHDLHLGEYRTSRPELGVDDYADLLEQQVRAGALGRTFDMVVHSTGALVVRAWLSRYYRPDEDSGLRRFIMAAPANNGSRLAHWGEKVPTDWSESVLRDLRFASAHTWALNWEWIESRRLDLTPGLSVYHLQGTNNEIAFPFLRDAIEDVVSISVPSFEEAGSDNTVRFAAANLEMHAVRIGVGGRMPRSFARMPRTRRSRVPLYTFPRKSHFGAAQGILGSVTSARDGVFACIHGILSGAPPQAPTPPRKVLGHAMIVLRVTDQHGNPYPEFRPQFYHGGGGDAERVKVVHRSQNAERDCYYLELKQFSRLRKFGLRIEANTRGKLRYAASEPIDLHWPDQRIAFLRPGITHFLEIAVERSVDPDALSFT